MRIKVKLLLVALSLGYLWYRVRSTPKGSGDRADVLERLRRLPPVIKVGKGRI